MRSRGLRLTELVLAVLLLACPLHAAMVEGIVAVVDKDPIMMSELETRAVRLGADPANDQHLGRVLELMVEERIIEQEYRRLGFPEPDVERITAFAESAQLAPADARIMLMRQSLMDLMVRSRVVVTPRMIEEVYDSREEYAGRESVHLKQILFAPDETAEQKVVAELDADQPFDEVATRHSEVLVGGSSDIGWIAVEDLADQTRAAIESLAAGEVTAPVRVGSYTAVFQLVERGEHGATPLEEVSEEIRKELEERYRREAFEHWLKMIRADHYVGIYL